MEVEHDRAFHALALDPAHGLSEFGPILVRLTGQPGYQEPPERHAGPQCSSRGLAEFGRCDRFADGRTVALGYTLYAYPETTRLQPGSVLDYCFLSGSYPQGKFFMFWFWHFLFSMSRVNAIDPTT